jgi:hypothetical protein
MKSPHLTTGTGGCPGFKSHYRNDFKHFIFCRTPAMLKRKRWLVCILVLLYAGTWVGGWISHSSNLRVQAEASYRMIKRDNQEMEMQARRYAETLHPIKLRKGGPTSGVNWCVPVLPGILIADSYYAAGPLHASGGVKIVMYYGVGSSELCTPWCWVA